MEKISHFLVCRKSFGEDCLNTNYNYCLCTSHARVKYLFNGTKIGCKWFSSVSFDTVNNQFRKKNILQGTLLPC